MMIPFNQHDIKTRIFQLLGGRALINTPAKSTVIFFTNRICLSQGHDDECQLVLIDKTC
ncbi:MAG TPA: hypothetical protein VKM55_21005 [Candidatus Lokiarchaeia archaeon]|nr:hypothetical protein [Candidatus Lokiarchaeia archaeon]